MLAPRVFNKSRQPAKFTSYCTSTRPLPRKLPKISRRTRETFAQCTSLGSGKFCSCSILSNFGSNYFSFPVHVKGGDRGSSTHVFETAVHQSSTLCKLPDLPSTSEVRQDKFSVMTDEIHCTQLCRMQRSLKGGYVTLF